MLLLSIHIGGAHITSALYDTNMYSLVPDSYVRMPISHKYSVDTILEYWEKLVRSYTSVEGIALAVPARFYQEQSNDLPEAYHSFPGFDGFDIKKHFGRISGLPESAITVFRNSEAFLYGELGNPGGLNGQVIGITVGTDLSAALADRDGIKDLNWEVVLFNKGIANNSLSTKWLMRTYYDRTGMSVLNVEQLKAFSGDSATARVLIKDYARTLSRFLKKQLGEQQYHVIIEGDITFFYAALVFDMAKRLPALTFTCAVPGKHSTLMGAARLHLKQMVCQG